MSSLFSSSCSSGTGDQGTRLCLPAPAPVGVRSRVGIVPFPRTRLAVLSYTFRATCLTRRCGGAPWQCSLGRPHLAGPAGAWLWLCLASPCPGAVTAPGTGAGLTKWISSPVVPGSYQDDHIEWICVSRLHALAPLRERCSPSSQPPYSSTCVPSSMTRSGGRRKKSVAGRALRDMRTNTFSRQIAMPGREVGNSDSRPRK